MTWMKVDEKVRSHKKLVQAVKAAGGDAGWFWLCGLAYAREQSTDGFIDDTVLDIVAPGLKGWKKAPAALVAANLWDRVEGGYRIRDYFEWNPSKAELDEARREERERKAAARAAARAAAEAARMAASGECPAGVREMSERTDSPRPYAGADGRASSPSPSGAALDVSGSSEGGPGETAPAVTIAIGPPPRSTVASRAAALGIVQPGKWERQHGSHALRADFCDWVCLPQAVHDEFVNRLKGTGDPHDVALVAVRRWALDVRGRWAQSTEIPGEDIFKFWRNEWAATHGSNRPVVASSRAQLGALDGVKEALRRG